MLTQLKSRLPIVIGAVVLIALLVVGVVLLNNNGVLNLPGTKPQVRTLEASKDYEALGTPEGLKVILTVDSSNMVTDLKLEETTGNENAAKYLVKFEEKMEGNVVGRKLDEEFERVNITGSSITSEAFWDAMDTLLIN